MLGYMQQARAALASGNRDAARVAVENLDRVFSPQAGRGFIADLGYAHARLGEPEATQRVYDLIQTLASTTYVGPEVQTYASLAIGQHDTAAEQLEAALRQRAELPLTVEPFVLTFIRDNVWSDPVLEEPRFVRLRQRIGND